MQKKKETELKAKHEKELKKVSSRAISRTMDDRTPPPSNPMYTVDDETAFKEMKQFDDFRKRSMSKRSRNSSRNGSPQNFLKKNMHSIKYIKPKKSRRSLSSRRSRKRIPSKINRHSKDSVFERDRLAQKTILDQHKKSRSRKQRRLLNEDFYSKYEVLTNYQDLISTLTLPKVHFGFRPKLWPEDKLFTQIEEILTFRSDL